MTQAAPGCVGTADEIKTTIGYGAQTAGTANNLFPISQTVANGSTGSSALSATTTTAYDQVGNVTSVTGPLGQSNAQTSAYFYDAMRRVVGVINPNPTGVSGGPNSATRFTYDADDHVIEQDIGTTQGQTASAFQNFSLSLYTYNFFQSYYDAPNYSYIADSSYTEQAFKQYSFDDQFRVFCVATRENGSVTGLQPSAQGQPSSQNACSLTTQGSNGPDQITQYAYDADGRIQSQTDGLGTSNQAVSVTTLYNPNGTIQSVGDANSHTTTYSYDGLDHLQTATYPDGSTEQYAYTTKTDLIQKFTMRDSSTITKSYDNLGRLYTQVFSAGPTQTFGYNLQGVATSIADTGTQSSVSYTYDVLGRPTQETEPNGTITYSYSLAGQYSTMAWPDGYVMTSCSDLLGNTVTIAVGSAANATCSSGSGTNYNVVATYSYTSLGNRSGVVFGNGTSRSYAYDTISRLAGLQMSFPNTPTANQTIGAVGGTGTAIAYTLASQILTLPRQNTAYSWANTYNVNRSYCPNNLNQYGNATSTCMPSTPNLAYDMKGNLTTSGTSAYTYDWLNRLISAPVEGKAASLAYDPLNRLVSYTPSATTNFLYAGSSLVEESTSGTVLSRYVPGPNPDDTVVWFQGADLSNPRYLQADERGSIVAMSDGGGGNVVINTYDEFGIPGPNNAGRFGYTGQMWLSEIGLYDYKARIYSPTLGRFMQADPIGYGDGLNMYNYAHGDPVNGSDPFGLADAVGCITEDCIAATVLSSPSNGDGSNSPFSIQSSQVAYSSSSSFASNGWDANSGTGFVNYNNYGPPGALPTIYGNYQATSAQPQSGAGGLSPCDFAQRGGQALGRAIDTLGSYGTNAGLITTGGGVAGVAAGGVVALSGPEGFVPGIGIALGGLGFIDIGAQVTSYSGLVQAAGATIAAVSGSGKSAVVNLSTQLATRVLPSGPIRDFGAAIANKFFDKIVPDIRSCAP